MSQCESSETEKQEAWWEFVPFAVPSSSITNAVLSAPIPVAISL